MNYNKTFLIFGVMLVSAVVAGFFLFYLKEQKQENVLLEDRPENSAASKDDLITVEYPRIGDKIKSPLTVKGSARGNWYFEASFPVALTDWDGRIIVEHYAQAQGDWMTADYVPFEATLEFESPVFPGADQANFSRRGYLILKKDNPSGLPEHDDSLEIPVFFE